MFAYDSVSSSMQPCVELPTVKPGVSCIRCREPILTYPFRLPQDVLTARLTGHTAAVTATAVQAGGRLAASVDVAGTAMVWRAADVIPVASVPAAAHNTGSQHSAQGAQLQQSSDGQQPSDRAVAWLPAPGAAVGIVPGSTGIPRAISAEERPELLLLADCECMRVWSIPAKPALACAAEPREVASAPMPEGCEGICQLTVLPETTGRTGNSSSTASATVLTRAQAKGDSEVVYTWHVARNDGSQGDGAQLMLVDELHTVDLRQHSEGSEIPQRHAAAFTTLLHHPSIQLATADPAAGEISLYRLNSTFVPGSQRDAPADAANGQTTQLVATASLREAGGGLGQPGQQARTANREATSVCVIDVALSASVRQLAAVGTQGATSKDMDTRIIGTCTLC